MDFIAIALIPILLLFIVSSAVTLWYKRKFNVNNPISFFNLLNIVVFLLYIAWLLTIPGGGSGAFAMFLFSIFFAPFVLILFNFLFKLLDSSDNKSRETNNKVVHIDQATGLVTELNQSSDQISR